MSIIETLVVFAGIPLAVIAVISGLVFAGGTRTHDRRYRPGRPFEFTPVWFLSAPEAAAHPPAGSVNGHASDHAAVTGADRLALTKADTPVADVTGGASDRW